MDSLWSGKFLRVESGIWEIFTGRIKSWALISGVQTKEYGIQESGFQVLDSRIHGVGYRIRGCLGFSYLEHFFPGCPYSCPLPPFVFSLFPLPPLLPLMYVIHTLYFFPFTFRLDNYWLYGFRRSHRRCNTSSWKYSSWTEFSCTASSYEPFPRQS